MELEDMLNQVIQGDCLKVMKQMPDKCVDLVLTDPPYGIGIIGKQNKASQSVKSISKAGGHYKKYDDEEWDNKIPDKEYFDEMLRIGKKVIIWGGNYMTEYLSPQKCWLIWDKVSGLQLPDAEIAWTNLDSPIRIFRESRADAYINNIIGTDIKEHPTQKSLNLMKWCIEKYSEENDLILDPFNGSGTTTRAAKHCKRRYIGIEISEKYCKIANDRLRQDILL